MILFGVLIPIYVGPGGSPDEDGETTLDALIMNGKTGRKQWKSVLWLP